MYEQKNSTSPLINCIWHAVSTQDGVYSDAANEYWGFGFTKRADGSLAAELIGPSLQPRILEGHKGEEYWGVELNAHVQVCNAPKQSLLGNTVELSVEGNTFEINGRYYLVPNYKELEAFVQQLETDGTIVSDTHIYRALFGDDAGFSVRNKQRRFRSVTGLTKKQIDQLQRVRYAFYLLQSGASPAQAASAAGYSDQAHMTRSFKMLRGETPAKIIASYLHKK